MQEAKVHFEYLNETYLRINASPQILFRFYQEFSFKVKGHKFMKSYQLGMWDGFIRLFDKKYHTIYNGLIHKLIEFAEKELMDWTADDQFFEGNHLTLDDFENYSKKFEVPYVVRGYQKDAVLKSFNEKRLTVISPTGSGKSFICYFLTRLHMEHNRKVLILVPELYHIKQLYNNFKDKFAKNQELGGLFKGINWKNDESVADANFVVSTVASVCKKDADWFAQFDAVIGDEAHKFKAKTFSETMEKCKNIEYRMCCTGSLDGVEVNELTVNGLFGSVYRVATATELIDAGQMAKPTIHAIILHYPDESIERVKSYQGDYDLEMAFVYKTEDRINFIAKLASSLKGHTLTLFRLKSYGKKLHTAIKKVSKKPMYWIDGDIDIDDREIIIEKIINSNESDAVCSTGTFATGIDVPNLNNAISTYPNKSRTLNIQSVGRTVRMSDNKNTSMYFDIVDKIFDGSCKKPNHLWHHWILRKSYYIEEGYDVIEHHYNL